ncbi:MAG: N-acetyltransferase family protein [Gemmataceae bacterium]
MSAQIRPATRADLPAIVAMRDDLNLHELKGCPHASIVRMELDPFTKVWGHTFDSPGYCWRLVELDGKPVGYGMIYLLSPRLEPPIAYVQWAYVAPTCRRLGLGERLMGDLADWAKQQGAGRIELQFIDGNEIAEGFWMKMGFQPYARRCVRYLP